MKGKISAQRIHLIDELLDSLKNADILDSADEDLSQFVIDRFIHYASSNKEGLCGLVYQDNGSGVILKTPQLKSLICDFGTAGKSMKSPVKSESELHFGDMIFSQIATYKIVFEE